VPIIASAKGSFIPAPEGTWQGVCIDVVDLGIEEYEYKGKKISAHKVQIRWILDAEPALESGKPHMAVRKFTLSLGEKSKLKPFLESWRGRKFTDAELEGFDVENLIGANAQIQILHNHKNGNTYSNVEGILPLGRGMTKMEVPADYVRQYIRDERAQLEANPNPSSEEPNYNTEIGDDDIPF
jgi:hypothetical protein